MRILAITPESNAFRAIASEIDTVEFVLASSLSLGLSLLNQGSWGMVLLDSAIDPDLTLDLVERLVGASHRVVVVVRDEPMTNTFQALERGATDTLLWPISAAELRDTLARCGSSKAIRARPEGISAKNGAPITNGKGPVALIGESGRMLTAVKTIARVADSTATVLLHGESGTGKELFARLLHE
jgi:DNA-binding NtrC family response regulator